MHLLRALLAAMAGLATLAAPLAQTSIPTIVEGINDPDRVLSAQQADDLNKKLAAFEQQKLCRIAVLIVRDIGRANLISYAGTALAAWTSAPTSSRQAVLLVVVADRENAWIEERNTALELETSRRIIFESMVPRFKAGHDIAGGIAVGLDQLRSVLGGNPLPPPAPEDPQNSLLDRLDSFRYAMEGDARFGYLREMLYLAIAAALGFGLRPFAGPWPAALLAALVAGLGSWLQYGFIVPNAAVAFVIVFRGWNAWFGESGKDS